MVVTVNVPAVPAVKVTLLALVIAGASFTVRAKLWMAEALGYKGRRVALTIMNARAPLTGTLIDVTHDELVLDQGGAQVTVNYGRLSGIDAA